MHDFLKITLSHKGFNIRQLVLGSGNCIMNTTRLNLFGVKVELFKNLSEQTALIRFIEDDKVMCEGHCLGFAAQDARAQGVESADVQAAQR